MSANSTNDGLNKELIDILIITALKKERDAIRERFDGDYSTIRESTDTITYYRGEIRIPTSDEKYEVALALLHDMGNIDSAIVATKAMEHWKPSMILMVGIGGGVQGKIGLGDVAVAKYVFYYEPGKVTPSGIQNRSEQYTSDPLLLHLATMYEANDWKGDIRQPIPGESAVAWKPTAHFGPIGSGEQVIADKLALQTLLDDCPKMIAVAMEGAGVAKAVSYNADRPRFLEIRGISDLADAHKGDDWQEVAADAAAAFAIGFLRTRPITPRVVQTIIPPKAVQPLLLLRAESLRKISNAEVIAGLPSEIQERDLTMVSLDFTDLVEGGVIKEPEEIVRRLTGPESPFLAALAQRPSAELVFCGLAHIPPVILAGHLVSDRQKVYLLDYHSGPGLETWTWPTIDNEYPSLKITGFPKRRHKRAGDAVIRVSISYTAYATQTIQLVNDPVLSIDITVPKPIRGIVKSEAQVRAYGYVVRQVLDTIAQDFLGVQRIHLFYAGPMALAFHIGQQISENIHPPVIAWNFSRGYDWAIDLRAALVGEDAILRPPSSL